VAQESKDVQVENGNLKDVLLQLHEKDLRTYLYCPILDENNTVNKQFLGYAQKINKMSYKSSTNILHSQASELRWVWSQLS